MQTIENCKKYDEIIFNKSYDVGFGIFQPLIIYKSENWEDTVKGFVMFNELQDDKI